MLWLVALRDSVRFFVLQQARHCFGAGAACEAIEDMPDMHVHRTRAEPQPSRDFLVRQPVDQTTRDFLLARA